MLSADNPYFQQVALLCALLPLVGRERCFALKGGTAINMFVRDLPRLSVDIDLTYLPIEDRATDLGNIGDALNHMADAMEAALRGVSVQRLAGEQDRTIKLQVTRGGVRVMIEVSPVLRGAVHEPVLRSGTQTVEQQFGFVEVPVLDTHELYAGKLCAALDRQHPRDLFDVKVLMDAEGVDADLIDVFLVYLVSGSRPLAEMLQPNFIPLTETFESQFRGMALNTVTLRELEETRQALVTQLHERLSDAHKQFLIGFKRGEPDWNLLKVKNVDRLPGVQWKLQNLRRMDAKKREAALEKLNRVLYG